MNKPNEELRKEVVELAARLCDDSLDDAEFDRLETLLLENAEARSIYLDFMSLHVGLKDHRTPNTTAAPVLSLAEQDESLDPLDTRPPAPGSPDHPPGASLTFPFGLFRCPESLGGFVVMNMVWLTTLITGMVAGSVVTGIAFSSTAPFSRGRFASSPITTEKDEPIAERGPVAWEFGETFLEPFDPPPVQADLALWLSADREIYADLQKNRPRNGQKVLAWTDRARGVCASQASPAERPVWLDAAISVGPYECRPALRFSGRQALHADMLVDVLRGEDRPVTIFTVVRFDYYDEPRRQCLLGWGRTDDKATLYEFGTTAPEDAYRPWNAFFTGRRDAAGHETFGCSEAEMVQRDRLFVLSAVDTGKTVSMFANGRTLFADQNVDVETVDFDRVAIGAIPYAGVPRIWLCGDLAEVLVYSRALGSAEHAAVEAYLLEKYGRTGARTE